MKKDILLQKWLNNDLSPEEQKAFQTMENSAFFEEIITEGKRFKVTTANKIDNFNTIEKRLNEKIIPKINWFKVASSIAALLVIGLSVFYFFDTNKLQTFNTQFSQKEAIVLPDNSLVSLNEDSKLQYNTLEWSTKKRVTLTGEAFFEVTKGKRFDVETPHGIISVLGTEFNVKARDSIFKVVCYEGLVQVKYKKQLIKLPAGNVFEVTKGNAEKFTIAVAKPQWLNNMSVFNQAKISDVLSVLARQYHIQVDYDSINTTVLFTGAFEHTNLKNSLNAITKTLNLTYEIKNNKVIIRNAKK